MSWLRRTIYRLLRMNRGLSCVVFLSTPVANRHMPVPLLDQSVRMLALMRSTFLVMASSGSVKSSALSLPGRMSHASSHQP